MWISKLLLGNSLISLGLGRKPFGSELPDPKTVTVGPAIVAKSSLGCDPPPLRGLLWGPKEGEDIYIIIII